MLALSKLNGPAPVLFRSDAMLCGRQFRRQTSPAFSDLKKLSTADRAHRNLEPLLAQQLLVVVGTVLRPVIGVMNAACWRPSDCDGHVQRTQSQILLHAIADRPAHYAP